MTIKKSIISYSKLSFEMKQALVQQYPFGIENALIDMKDQYGKEHKAIMLQLQNHVYLIKMTKKDVLSVLGGEEMEDLNEDVNISDMLNIDEDSDPNVA